MKPLTEKEQEIYDFIAQSIRRDGFSPSVRDIAPRRHKKHLTSIFISQA